MTHRDSLAWRGRSWTRSAGLLLGVIVLGLLWRSGWLPLSTWAMKYGGDAAWATAIMLALALVWRRAATWKLALAGFIISSAIEFSQLYHGSPLAEIRRSHLGAILVGTTFNWPDFAAYAVGTAVGAAADLLIRGCSRRVSR